LSLGFGNRARELSLRDKIGLINWGLVVILTTIAAIGCSVLYSAANGHGDPWANASMARYGTGLAIMLVTSVVDLRLWYRLAYPVYGVGLVLLALVDLHGVRGLGAQRWLELGPVSLQPSEIMKIGLVMALARYFHSRTLEQAGRPLHLILPLLLFLVPAALVLKQPDLGTAMMLGLATLSLFFLAGVRMRMFALAGFAILAMGPIAWRFMRGYQKTRLLSFLNPQNDNLGAGYHLMQSEIALGSGGMWGKGFMQGTQSHLDFLPEKQTDFIFTMYAEEFGMAGGLMLLALYGAVLAYGFAISMRCRNQFGRLLGLGITCNFFCYVFINIAMVMGLLPVVGVPLPLISYGGTAMLTLMFGFGLLGSVSIHRDTIIGHRGVLET
jgi:rod shape determining protein RodA